MRKTIPQPAKEPKFESSWFPTSLTGPPLEYSIENLQLSSTEEEILSASSGDSSSEEENHKEDNQLPTISRSSRSLIKQKPTIKNKKSTRNTSFTLGAAASRPPGASTKPPNASASRPSGASSRPRASTRPGPSSRTITPGASTRQTRQRSYSVSSSIFHGFPDFLGGYSLFAEGDHMAGGSGNKGKNPFSKKYDSLDKRRQRLVKLFLLCGIISVFFTLVSLICMLITRAIFEKEISPLGTENLRGAEQLMIQDAGGALAESLTECFFGDIYDENNVELSINEFQESNQEGCPGGNPISWSRMHMEACGWHHEQEKYIFSRKWIPVPQTQPNYHTKIYLRLLVTKHRGRSMVTGIELLPLEPPRLPRGWSEWPGWDGVKVHTLGT